MVDIFGTASDDLSGIDRILVEARRIDGDSEPRVGFANFDAATGEWSLADVDFTEPGTYEITVEAVDRVGNFSDLLEASQIQFIIPAPDVTDPVGVGLTPAAGSSNAPGVYDVSGVASDDASGVERVRVQVRLLGDTTLFWNGSAFVESSAGSFRTVSFDEVAGEWTLPGVDLSALGTYEVRVNVRDNEGNVASSSENEQIQFTIE